MDMNYGFISDTPQGTVISVKLVPNSSFSKIVDYNNDFIRIKISSPALENRANKELISFCSGLFCVNKSKIDLISGEKSKLKRVLIKDVKPEDIIQKLMFVLDSVNKDKKGI